MDCEITIDSDILKKLTKLLPNYKVVKEVCKRIVFSKLVQSANNDGEVHKWCCGKPFESDKDFKRHISSFHSGWITEYAEKIENSFFETLKERQKLSFFETDAEKYICDLPAKFVCNCTGNFKVVLYYHYTDIKLPSEIIIWQKDICQKLNLTGKIRIASEGMNGTLEGCECGIAKYVAILCKRFQSIVEEDFKMSNGNGKAFENLKITECVELCAMGISPNVLKATEGGKHLTPQEFHHEIEKDNNDTILLDCRNFYESKIGYFHNAVRPDLRKFSYFPNYVDKNAEIFKDKRVLMYCTGGIRCERASAYVKKTAKCKEVLQLKGGIHKYLEEYPEGHYEGKLFVFDERYSIGGATQTPVSNCKYCCRPYDQYRLCTTSSCRQLVLACNECRTMGKTTCCEECESTANVNKRKQECECTRTREQIPIEKLNNC